MKASNPHILIFGEGFFPPAYLPRVRYFCNYFAQKGWDVNLIYERNENQKYIPTEISTLPIEYYKYKKGLSAKLEWLFKFILNLFWDHKGCYFYKKSQKFLDEKKIDLVFCSSSFTFPLTTAGKVAQKLNIPLFVDLRDIAEQSPDDNHYIANKPPKIFGNLIINIYKTINIKRRNKILKIADGITTVSPWHVQTLSTYNPNTYLIYNGFDESKFIPEKISTERFTISYFGRVFNENIRNPRLLFEALRTLNNKNLISSQNTVVKWYIDVNSKNVIKKIVSEYHLEEFNEYHEFISPDELVSEMNKSSILLTLSNIPTQKRYFGIMTTKFFESIGVNRPVLCIPDNKNNLSELIKDTNCGLVSSNVTELEKYLLNNFYEWKKTGHTTGNLSKTARLNFSRKKGAEILESLFTEKMH